MSAVPAMTRPPIGTFKGGIQPEDNKRQSAHEPLITAPLPAQLVLPLSQHQGSPAELVVAVGDTVLAGQLLAKATQPVSAAVHAPTSGTIVAIRQHPVPHPSGLPDTCIVLDCDGNQRWGTLSPVSDDRSLTPEQLIARIHAAGINGLGGAGFPTAAKLATATPVTTLIINGAECEPYITADDRLMQERAEAVIKGAIYLCRGLQPQECLIAIEDNKPAAIQAIQTALAQYTSTNHPTVAVVVVPTRYPSGGEKQLVQLLTGQEIPTGQHPPERGIMVQNVGTVAAIYDALAHGRPLIARVVTVTGAALARPRNITALLGTPIRHLLTLAGLQADKLSRLMVGGPLMGFTVDSLDIPITKTTNCIIAGTAAEFPPPPAEQACIRCGLCAEVCPASLLPQQLYWHANAQQHEQLMRHNLFDCIECGACAYVCPSAIPLVQYYRAAKGSIRAQADKHKKAERAKQRFEHRQARLAKEKAEQAARRQAHAARATRLRAQTLAEQAADDNDPVKAAIARANAKKAKQPQAVGQAAPIPLAAAKSQLDKYQKLLNRQPPPANAETLRAQVRLLHDQVARLQQACKQQPTEPCH